MPRGRSKDSGRSNHVRCGLEHELALSQAALGSDIHFTAQLSATSNFVFADNRKGWHADAQRKNFALLGILTTA